MMSDKMEVVVRYSIPSQRARRGVTLAEMIVVMTIIVAIMVGIWTAANPLQRKEKVSAAKDEINLIVDNVRSYYGGRALTATGSCASLASLTPLGHNVFPGDMVSNSHVRNPWDKNLSADTALVYVCDTNPVKMVIRFTGVPFMECVDLLMSTSGDFAGMNLLQINVNGTTATSGSVLLLPTAQTRCDPSGGTIDWYFKVSG